MPDIAQQNAALLEARWPGQAARITSAPLPTAVRWQTDTPQPSVEVQGFRLWSAYDPEAEASIQASLVPESAESAWVYGIGSGDLIRTLLDRSSMRRLKVVWLNPGVVRLLMESLDHRDWLQDPRVELVDGSGEAEPRFPFAVVPPCLQLGSEAAGRLCEWLSLELTTPFERERQNRRKPMREKQIQQNLSLIESDGDVKELFDTVPGVTAFVAIAGPTLKQTASHIQAHRKEGVLIAVDGALAPLLDMGVVPDFAVTADDLRKTILPYFSVDLSRCKGSTLVYAPVVHHDVLMCWPGRRLTAYTFQSIYDEVRRSHPKGELWISGSVSHMAVDLAIRMGAVRVLLFGADFGFPGENIHANEHAPLKFYANGAKAGVTAANGHGQVIRTLNSFNGYRLDLEKYIAEHRSIEFINMSRDGVLINGARYFDEVPG